jgi:ABC-type polysaccharide/polyol phosphate transport system ATPase subunit
LNITVTSGAGKAAAKPKGKARAEGLEILANATLKLKAGVHYALIGRNGTGKSSKLFPHLLATMSIQGLLMFGFHLRKFVGR